MFRSLFIFFVTLSALSANTCIECHEGIEDIRDKNSQMMKQIYEVAKKAGHEGNDCVVCHGGNPNSKAQKYAHLGTIEYFKEHEGPKEFYPDPSSPWINKNSCGVCHKEHVSAQFNSLMMTEQGKIQGVLWGFGKNQNYKHNIGNYSAKNIHERLGTQAYKAYMEKLEKLNPQVYPKKNKELSLAPTADEVEKNPSLAAYTYLRQECLRCHTGSAGRSERGDFRGLGCSSCHIPYSNSGLYEGKGKNINTQEAGHMLTHQIQATREAKVNFEHMSYSGIPVETCTTCHNRGKRIGTSYQGLMETSFNPTYTDKGEGQPPLHTKNYLHLTEDIHYKKGMLCQDCHTSNDMHSDGFLSGSTLAPVEIECQDCHGTTQKYPWELPLGYSDEFATTPAKGTPRKVATTLAEYLKQGTLYDKKDGYLFSARGNPLGNVVKSGNDVIVHLASGKDITLEPLKKLKRKNKLSKEALVAMDSVSAHRDRLECYSCHATWAPQCYGCHIKIDYSEGKQGLDYLAMAKDHDKHGLTADKRLSSLKKYLIDGEVTETRGYLRWENPPLSQNGEGRISPTIPGCQTSVTVIGKEGNALLQNHIFRVSDVEGANEEGQLAIDMSPTQPHTTSKKARSCESCHTNPAAMGYGIEGGALFGDSSKDLVVELMDADGRIIPKNYQTQKERIENLTMDWSRFVDENGTQLQTVGHHFKLSQPLSNESRAKLDRRGVCISCHKTMPNKDLAVSLLVHLSDVSKMHIDRRMHEEILHKNVVLGAWVQVLFGLSGIAFVVWFFYNRKRRKRTD